MLDTHAVVAPAAPPGILRVATRGPRSRSARTGTGTGGRGPDGSHSPGRRAVEVALRPVRHGGAAGGSSGSE
eukprot:21702-Lingulodinium_polyedra.AAC.1